MIANEFNDARAFGNIPSGIANDNTRKNWWTYDSFNLFEKCGEDCFSSDM